MLAAPVAGSFFWLSSAMASAIVAPHGAGRDGDLAGNTVAAPDDASSALLFNPAGVVSTTRDQAVFAVMPFNFSATYKNTSGDYNGKSSQTPMGLVMWYGLGEIAGWSMGVGAYGSIGAAFDFPADKNNGQTSPYTGKLSIVNFGLNAGRQIAPGLRVGFQIAPRYGVQVMRMPSPLGDVDFDADGFGVSGSAGLVYDASERLSLGLAYRSEGIVDMKGEGTVGDVHQDISVKLITPQALTGGAAFQWTKRVRVMGQLNWTEYQQFERGDVEFDTSSMMDGPVIASARNRIRWGMGLEFEVRPGSMLRAGFTTGKAMIEDNSMSPMMFDNDNTMFMAGYEIDYGDFMVGFNGGYLDLKPRTVDAADNPYFAGTYDGDADVAYGIRVTWKLRKPG